MADTPSLNLPPLPKNIDKETQDYLTALTKVLSDKQANDYRDSENIKEESVKIKSEIPSFASEAQAIAGTDDTTIITPLKIRKGLNASGSAPVYACRAWVNFDGTTSPITINACGNVSSITDGGVGIYTINFTTAMQDADYVLVGEARSEYTNKVGLILSRDSGATKTASSCKLYFVYNNASSVSLHDAYDGCLIFLR
jgi:hypothetical protein